MTWSTSALVRPLRSTFLMYSGYTFEKAIVKMRCFSAMDAPCVFRRHLYFAPSGTDTGKPVKVPFARKWQQETEQLRKVALGCGLAEETKWGKPCFTCQGKNVAIVIPLKDACALSFFKGALLADSKHLL